MQGGNEEGGKTLERVTYDADSKSLTWLSSGLQLVEADLQVTRDIEGFGRLLPPPYQSQ